MKKRKAGKRKYRRPRRPLPKSTEEPPLILPKFIRELFNLPNSIIKPLNLPKSVEEEPKVCINRIRINDLPDDLLVKIILLIPLKNAVATCLLSKRWENLWKLLPKFEFSDSSRKRASSIIHNFLVHNNAPFLETLHLKLSRNYAPEDYEKWAEAAVARNVRDLELLHYRADLNPIPFPRILYTCQTLVALRLQQTIIVDVPSAACFRSLKDLSLLRVSFSSGEIVSRFLSVCPNLETLILIRIELNARLKYREVVINAPSLKTLKIDDKYYVILSVSNMLELVTAEIKLRNGCDSKFLGCLTSAKHLSLCFEPKLDGCLTSDFNQLVSLELCIICGLDWFGVILKHTPKLRVLKLRQKTGRSNNKHCGTYMSIRHRWDKPSCVPECLISSLETVEWDGYKETGVEREVAIYFLENAKRLETVAIIPPKSTSLEEKLKMIMELKSTSRCSSKFLLY